MPEQRSHPTAPVSTGAVGVLFDIDDTLVDLRSAMRGALLVAAAAELEGLGEEERAAFATHFSADEAGFYDKYVKGKYGFAEQRHLRLQAALAVFGRDTEQEARAFSTVFEETVRKLWAAFPDVHEVLDRLDAAGIPYAAVTNNVEGYQREKLAVTGLRRIEVVIGTDTVGASKPDPRTYLEAVRRIGSEPSLTLMVGANPGHDVAGARAAGLSAVLIDRFSSEKNDDAVTTLTEIMPLVSALIRR